MREKIAELRPKISVTINEPFYQLASEGIDQILALLCEEIEKVENPYPGNTSTLGIGFERCRQKILALLQGDKEVK